MSKQISINKFEKCLDAPYTDVTFEYTDGVEITLQPLLTVDAAIEFVEDVASVVINEDTGTYIPEMYTFALRKAILTHYANFKMPEGIEKEYGMLMRSSDLISFIFDHVDYAQITGLIDAIDRTIEYRKQKVLSNDRQALIAEVNKLNTINRQLEESLDMPALQSIMAELAQMNPNEIVKSIVDAKEQPTIIERGE